MDQNKILPQGLNVPDRTNQYRTLKGLTLGVLAAISFAITWKLIDVGLFPLHGLVFWLIPALTAAVGVSFLAFLAVVDINPWFFWGTNFAILATYIVFLPHAPASWIGGLLFFL